MHLIFKDNQSALTHWSKPANLFAVYINWLSIGWFLYDRNISTSGVKSKGKNMVKKHFKK